MNNLPRLIACLLTVSLLTGFTYGYKNNSQTGKPDMVVFSIASGDLPIFGNASTAKRLTTARTINGVNFDGSANVTVPAQATGGSAGKTVCWKTATVLGYCSTIVDVTGNCTCN